MFLMQSERRELSEALESVCEMSLCLEESVLGSADARELHAIAEWATAVATAAVVLEPATGNTLELCFRVANSTTSK